MSRADRYREMGPDAWDEWTPEDLAKYNKGKAPQDHFKPSRIPGVVMTPGVTLPKPG